MEMLIGLIIFAPIFIIINAHFEQKKLIKAQLFLQLFEKLNKDADFKRIERLLDDSESFNFNRLIENEKENFDEYLRFFDSMVVLKIPELFLKSEADLLFARPSELLRRHYLVRNHIALQNYKNLDAILKLSENEEKKSLSKM